MHASAAGSDNSVDLAARELVEGHSGTLDQAAPDPGAACTVGVHG
jgi:hypothetical protein